MQFRTFLFMSTYLFHFEKAYKALQEATHCVTKIAPNCRQFAMHLRNKKSADGGQNLEWKHETTNRTSISANLTAYRHQPDGKIR